MADLTLGDYELDDDSNGNFVLKDKNDNIVLQWDSNNAEWNLNDVGSVDGGGSAVNIDDDLDLQSSQNLSNASSVSTGEADISNETHVDVSRDATQTLSAGDWETIKFDTIKNDNRSEWDDSAWQFSPDKTGVYDVKMGYGFFGGLDGDQRLARVRDLTDNVTILRATMPSSPSNISGSKSRSVKLDSSHDYDVQFYNKDSSDETRNKSQTYLTIRSEFDES